jgi:hypothetical protein
MNRRVTISVRSLLGLASAFDAPVCRREVSLDWMGHQSPVYPSCGLLLITSVFVETVTIPPLISYRNEDHRKFQCQQTELLIGEPYGFRTFI